jgi:hypothetical protein
MNEKIHDHLLRRAAERANQKASDYDPLYQRLSPGTIVDTEKDAKIAALEERVRELEAKLIEVNPPTERGFIIAGKFAAEQFDTQVDWLEEIEDIARRYAGIEYLCLVELPLTVDLDEPTGPVIYFTPYE